MCINVVFWRVNSNRHYKGVKTRASKSAKQWGDYSDYFVSSYQSSLEIAVLKAIKILVEINSTGCRKS